MNYAEDRLDRRARHIHVTSSSRTSGNDSSSLWADYNRGLELLRSVSSVQETVSSNVQHDLLLAEAHTWLGRTLRDVGWCRHAVYHYGMAWRHHAAAAAAAAAAAGDRGFDHHHGEVKDALQSAAGDYAQMVELAGFPDVALVALLLWQSSQHWNGEATLVRSGNRRQQQKQQQTDGLEIQRDPLWLQTRPIPDHHCGCGSSDCGAHSCFLPVSLDDLEPIVSALHDYLDSCDTFLRSTDNNMPTAHQILGNPPTTSTSQRRNHNVNSNFSPCLPLDDAIPPLLQFWRNHDNGGPTRPLQPVLQLLLTKLLYVTLPTLAAHAVVRLMPTLEPQAAVLSQKYKSHWAYYVLIRSVLLGERIKPHRRAELSNYHVPVWDLLWNLDHRRCYKARSSVECDREYCNDDAAVSSAQAWTRQLRRRLASACRPTAASSHSLSISVCIPSCHPPLKPLFVVGDSHVLSLAWQTILVPTTLTNARWQPRLAVPLVVTGLKAWHCRPGTCFFTHTLLHTMLEQHCNNNSTTTSKATTTTVLWSAGEIDCREGMGGPLLEGYGVDSSAVRGHIERTVRGYVHALEQLACQYKLQVLVLPVAPHAYRSERNGKKVGRAFRRQVMRAWNEVLQQQIGNATTTQQEETTSTSIRAEKQQKSSGVYLLDYERHLLHPGSGYVLRARFNADGTHMNSAFLPYLEQAIQECGCDLELL